MRIVVYLQSVVGAFRASPQQIVRLAARLPRDTVVSVATKEQFVVELPEADAAVVWSFPEKWYPAAPRLRHVYTPAAGRERIAPDPNGRVELHFGGFQGALMAESLLAMMLFMNRRLGRSLECQRTREWEPRAYEGTRRLAGQIALILGYGRIGQRAGALLSAVGVRVHGLKRDLGRGGQGAERLFAPEELSTALPLADHVVCILPSDTGTRHLLDEQAFALMKPQAVAYNLGRGNAIDPVALLHALRSSRIAGAFLDVLPDEPLPPESALWDAPNLYVTPHASAIYDEYLDLYFDELVEEMARADPDGAAI